MKSDTFQKVMDEHIHLPGCPQLVVTRGFAYQWLQKIGYKPSDTGLGGLSHLVFSPPTTDEPLTDLEAYRSFLDEVVDDMNRSSDSGAVSPMIMGAFWIVPAVWLLMHFAVNAITLVLGR